MRDMKHNGFGKRLCLLAVAVCMMLACMPLSAFAEETEEIVIPEDAIWLSTPEDILTLAENCVSDAWSRNKVVVLKNDIDLSGVDFVPIPTFGGTFLGQGFTVSGLRLSGEQNAQGFFRYLQKTALVDGLHLKGNIQPDKNGNLDVGGLVGVNSGRVNNCSFTGTVSGTERIGGIAGRNKVSGVIENCTVSGIVSGDHYIGGIAGENGGVIRFCVNRGEVNTHVDHNSVSAVMSELSLENFTARESVRDATNIGGIAGTSSGVIRGCENRANVGYEKMGYNVGGIAGSQIGYITECVNYGTVNGSDGVGGIVGQFKPNVVLNMGENYMSELMDQMIDLMGSMSGMMNSMQGMMGDMSFDQEDLEDSMDILKDPENWDSDSINAALNEMSNAFNGMYQDMVSSGSQMTGQMEDMMGSMGGMVETMEKLNEGLNIKIVDISKEDTPENTQTKVSDCANYGSVRGETYVGGIAGVADIEDTTAQEDIRGELTMSTEGEMIMRLVIRDCRNAGRICANKQYAGGIVGNMTIGAVFNGMNTGSIDGLKADYVGGIAGRSETYLVGSVSRCILAGNRYVGGIAGFGKEVVGCYAVTEIAAATKFAGGILGSTNLLPDENPGLILENRYYLTGENLGGIDGICYDGATAPMSIAEFLDMETLDDMFRKVTVRFVAEGQEDTVITVGLGKNLASGKIPQLDVSGQEQYQWQLIPPVTAQAAVMGAAAEVQYISRERLTDILFDQTYVAVFDAKNMVVASEEKTETGRNLALAVGAFDKDTTLNLTDISGQVSVINGAAVAEAWQVAMADIGIEKLHYHIPEGVDAGRILLYVQDSSGSWVQRDFTVEGSYMIFPFTHGERGFALEVLSGEEFPVVPVVIGAGMAVALLIGGIILKKRTPKKGAAVEK